ncbi:MAG: type I glyceraldehyde-3-phosphate dehydrogenase [Deltaproteobacteria bacterium]|nr:MAG: type I glyceraldehyde-3-phosphate dehydrogenase [Deltaproteobacteria bacterium]
MSLKVGIVGFGRIGRALFRLGFDRPGIEFVAICDDGDADSLLYLLNHSTVEGAFDSPARLVGNHIVDGSQRARIMKQSKPGAVPWDSLGVDYVFDCTGEYRTEKELSKHCEAGARLVISSTPSSDASIPVIVRGVNCAGVTGDEVIISCGSSSIHALSLVLKVLIDGPGVDAATMTSVHAYTGNQHLSDSASVSLRWSRSAAQNIIPNETWAPEVASSLLPKLNGKIDGLALNVPVAAGSNIDLVTKLGKALSVEEVNALFLEASQGAMKGLMGYTDAPIVSSDVIGDRHSALFDSNATLSMESGLVKTLAWFDNGWAFAERMLETAEIHAIRGGAL